MVLFFCFEQAAVAMMTRCWAQDLVPFGITVNCIGPGATDTGLMLSQVDHPDAMKGLMNAIPVGRMVRLEPEVLPCSPDCHVNLYIFARKCCLII